MIEIIRVGMADLKAARHPSILTTLAWIVCRYNLYDPKQKLVWLILCYHTQTLQQPLQTEQVADTGIVIFWKNDIPWG